MGKKRILILISFLIFLFSCAKIKSEKTSYFNWNINIKSIRRIAILPFQSYTREGTLSSTLREIVLAEVLSQNIFDVVDLSLTDLVVFEEGLEKSLKMDKMTLKRIGERLKVQALLLGSLTYLEEVTEGSYKYPVVGISLRLIDVNSGEIIWECKGIKSGYSILGRIFGFRAPSSVELAHELIKEMLKDWKA